MLRKAHQALVQLVLNLNERVSEHERRASLEWKVLIYDDRALAILSTLLKVSGLVEVGVMFHDSITKKRDPIPNVKAVYLVEPTDDNFARIADDCANFLYESVHINFLSWVQSRSLEHLASMVADRSDGSCIEAIFDQFLDFSSPDPGLFCLRESDNYLLDIYGFRASDEVVTSACGDIGRALVSVFLTAGEVPGVLYLPESEVARLVYEEFDKGMRQWGTLELVGDRRSESPDARTPVLVLLDRTVDLAGPLHHPDSYQALIHDTIGIRRNQCHIEGKEYDLDADVDAFWAANRCRQFEAVARALHQDVDEFTRQYGAIESDLQGTVARLPELQHRKRSNATHTQIGDRLLKAVQGRKTNELFKLESDIFLQRRVAFDAIREVLQQVKEPLDKLRFVTIALLWDAITGEQLAELAPELGADTAFLRDCVAQHRIGKKPNQRYLTKLWSSLSRQGQENAVAASLPVAQYTRDIIDGNLESFTWGGRPITGPRGNLYIFVIGPGSYVEYCGVMQAAGKESVTYGCTSMLTPNTIMEQLRRIGDRS
jgi:hypothetical protein